MTQLTHFNQTGDAHMVDISTKAITERMAVTSGCIRMKPETLRMIMAGEHKKGDVLAIARTAGIMAAKKTADLVPLCHPLPLTFIEIALTPDPAFGEVRCMTTVKTNGQTGVEMEGLCATQVALLTIYDMCKAIDRGMVIDSVCLLEKVGGKSGHWQRSEDKN